MRSFCYTTVWHAGCFSPTRHRPDVKLCRRRAFVVGIGVAECERSLGRGFPLRTGTTEENAAQTSHSPLNRREETMIEPAVIVAFVSFAAYVLLGNFVTGRL